MTQKPSNDCGGCKATDILNVVIGGHWESIKRYGQIFLYGFGGFCSLVVILIVLGVGLITWLVNEGKKDLTEELKITNKNIGGLVTVLSENTKESAVIRQKVEDMDKANDTDHLTLSGRIEDIRTMSTLAVSHAKINSDKINQLEANK